MAVDEMLLDAVVGDNSLPTLRLYDWEPACLSLGYAQPLSDVRLDELNKDGYWLVRRPTGGRAILHIDELTYSVIGSEDDPRLKGGVLESYRVLSQALLQALHLLGIPAQSDGRKSGESSRVSGVANPVCFEVPSNYEITVDGKKLVGSAQARRKNGVLQHGTFPLYGDITRIVNYLQFPDEKSRRTAARRLIRRALTAESILGAPIPWKSAADAFETAFKQVLNITFLTQDLSDKELELVDILVKEKYGNQEWTERVLKKNRPQ